MNRAEAERLFLQQLTIRRQDVALAEAYLLRELSRERNVDFTQVPHLFAISRGANPPAEIHLRPDLELASFGQGLNYVSSMLAASEAVWQLIHRGVLMTGASGQTTTLNFEIRYTTAVGGSGGEHGGFRLDDCVVYIPVSVHFAPSHRQPSDEEVLTDPDLFVMEAGIDGADVEICDALKDSVECFRHGLFRPTAVLLGKAMEGAWTELGLSIADAIRADGQNASKLAATMTKDSHLNTRLKVVQTYYKNPTLTGNILDRAGVSPSDLDEVLVWSEVLREARNAIHFGNKPTIPNSYEKVAVLLIAGAKYLGTLYSVKRCADQHSGH